MFCTQRCHRIARTLFRELLADGDLAPLLQAKFYQAQKEGDGQRAQELMRRLDAAYVGRPWTGP